MPCSGPSIPYDQAKEAYEDVYKYMKEKYKLFSSDEVLDKISPAGFRKNCLEQRNKAEEKLREAVLDLFTCDAFESW